MKPLAAVVGVIVALDHLAGLVLKLRVARQIRRASELLEAYRAAVAPRPPAPDQGGPAPVPDAWPLPVP